MKATFILAIGLSVVPVFAIASSVPGLDHFLQNRSLSAGRGSFSKAAATSCADLSGEWSGKCEMNGQMLIDDLTLSIKQTGCEQFVQDGQNVVLDSLKTETSSGSVKNGVSGSYSLVTSARWESGGKELLQNVAGIVKLNPGEETVFSGKALSKLDGAKLRTDLDVAGQKIICVYSRR